MTIDEINDQLMELDGQRSAIKEKMVALVQERDRLTTQESAVKKILAMSPAERKALGIPEPQVVEAEGLESAAVVGTPGN